MTCGSISKTACGARLCRMQIRKAVKSVALQPSMTMIALHYGVEFTREYIVRCGLACTVLIRLPTGNGLCCRIALSFF